MKQKTTNRRTTTSYLAITIFIIISLIGGEVEGKFINQTIINEGVNETSMRVSSSLFFYQNQIIAPIESFGSTPDLRSYLFQYSQSGKLLKTLTFPLECPYFSHYYECEFQFKNVIVMDNWMITYLSVEDDQDMMLYKVDLDQFAIIEERDIAQFPERYQNPQTFMQYDDEEFFWIGKNLIQLAAVFPMSTSDLKFTNKSHYLPINYVREGGATSPLSSHSLFFVCGETKDDLSDSLSYNFLFNFETKEQIWKEKAEYGCYFSSFLGDTSLLAQVVNINQKTGVGLVDLSSSSSSLPSSISYQILWRNSPPINSIADNENIFLFVEEVYYPPSSPLILQINIGNSNAPNLVTLDSLNLESGYSFYRNYRTNIQSLGVNPNGGQFVYVAKYSEDYYYGKNSASSIFLVNYDNSN